MAWTAKGEERVKNYRVYRELEDSYNRLLDENERLRQAIAGKDELIRRMAAELSGVLRPSPSPGPPKSDTMPVGSTGVGPSVTETSSGKIKGVRPGSYSILTEGPPSTTEALNDYDPVPHVPSTAGGRHR